MFSNRILYLFLINGLNGLKGQEKILHPAGVGVRDLTLSSNEWCRPGVNNPRYLGARRPIE